MLTRRSSIIFRQILINNNLHHITMRTNSCRELQKGQTTQQTYCFNVPNQPHHHNHPPNAGSQLHHRPQDLRGWSVASGSGSFEACGCTGGTCSVLWFSAFLLDLFLISFLQCSEAFELDYPFHPVHLRWALLLWLFVYLI